MTERDTGATRRNPRPSGSPHMVMEAMACGCRLLDRSENANCDTPTQGPSANPIPLSPTMRTTRLFPALFHPSTYLSFKLLYPKTALNRYDFVSSRYFLFPFSRQRATDYVAGRETSNLVARPDSTRLDPTLCPALPVGPTELDANRK